MSRTTTSHFDIKSATIQGLSLILRTSRLEVIKEELAARMASAGDLFTNAPVLIHVTALTADGTAEELDLSRLIKLLRRHTMRAVGIVGATGLLLQQAQALGLLEEEDIAPRAHRPAPEPELPVAPQTTGVPATTDTPTADPSPAGALFGATTDMPSSVVSATPPDSAATAEEARQPQAAPTRVIDRPVRSGQRIYARGGDLVVLGVVSHGAEVIADGNIHVYGPLRGRAIAGASGNVDARIFAAAMEPELISIAGTYRTTDTPLASDVVGKPAHVRLQGDKLLIEPLKS